MTDNMADMADKDTGRDRKVFGVKPRPTAPDQEKRGHQPQMATPPPKPPKPPKGGSGVTPSGKGN